MCEGSDGLHLDGVPLLQRMVQNSGGVNHLPPQVLVVCVTDVQRLGRECVRLDLDIGASDFVDEARLAHVGKAADEEGPCVWIDRRKTTQMLPDLFKVSQALALTLHDGCHSAEGGSFELLASVQRVSVLQQPDVVFRDVVNLEFVNKNIKRFMNRIY